MTGARLRQLREACGWSQPELAAHLGRPRSAVAHWEAGRAPVPPAVAVVMQRIAVPIRKARKALETIQRAQAKRLPRFIAGHWRPTDG